VRGLRRNLPAYRAAGVADALTPADEALPRSRRTFTLVFRSPSTRIYHLAGATPYFTASSPACTLRTKTRDVVQLSCPGPAPLARLETALRGWRAGVDGHRPPL